MGLNIKAIIKICGLVIMFIGCFTFIPTIVSLIYGEIQTAMIFLFCGLIFALIGCLLFFSIKNTNRKIKSRDGLFTVNMVWLLTIILGAIPLSLAADISFIDAIFEATSGFTTTGATVIADVESLPNGVLFWRTFTHWIGGLGIIILVISILPSFGKGGYVIAQAEASKSMTDKIMAKYTDTAKRLVSYYAVMTVLCTVFLWIGKMNFFDSITHAMGAISTGGFSNYNAGLTELGSYYEYWVLIVFMVFGSINFTLYYYLFSKHWQEFFRDTELRWFIIFFGGASFLLTLDVFYTGTITNLGSALTHGTFNLVSTMSTTGLASANYDLWPTFAKMIILLAMFIGGCSASTSGGLKVYRIVIVLKLIKRNISRRLHPHAIVSIKSDEGPMRSDFVSAVAAYVFLYIVVIFVSSILLSLENQDFTTTASAVIACTGNVGPGFNEVGPLGNYDVFSAWGKLILSFDMLAGRLEMFGIILLFTRRFWNPDRFRV